MPSSAALVAQVQAWGMRWKETGWHCAPDRSPVFWTNAIALLLQIQYCLRRSEAPHGILVQHRASKECGTPVHPYADKSRCRHTRPEEMPDRIPCIQPKPYGEIPCTVSRPPNSSESTLLVRPLRVQSLMRRGMQRRQLVADTCRE